VGGWGGGGGGRQGGGHPLCRKVGGSPALIYRNALHSHPGQIMAGGGVCSSPITRILTNERSGRRDMDGNPACNGPIRSSERTIRRGTAYLEMQNRASNGRTSACECT